MKKDVSDMAGSFILSCNVQELSADSPLCSALSGGQFHAQYGGLIRGLTDTDQGRSPHLRMLVEDTLGGNRKKNSPGGDHAVTFPSTEPDTSPVVKVAQIPRAMARTTISKTQL